MRVSQPIAVALPNYGVLFAESVHAANFRMAERADPYHKLIYLFEGRLAYREKPGKAPLEAGAGEVLIVPRGVTHHLADRETPTLLLLCLTGDFLELDPELARLWLTLARIPGRRLHLGRPARQRLEGMWRRAMVEKDRAQIGGSVAVRSLAAQTLVLLARLPEEGGGATSAARVEAVEREIEETFYDQWDLDRAAARAGLSRRRFSALFRKSSGKTFWDFLTEQRLDHAAKLLRGGEHSVMGVMFSCGFSDLSHFYRMFRRRYGAAPRAWQKGTNNNTSAKALPKLAQRGRVGLGS